MDKAIVISLLGGFVLGAVCARVYYADVISKLKLYDQEADVFLKSKIEGLLRKL